MKTIKDLKLEYKMSTGNKPVNNIFFDYMDMEDNTANEIQNYIEWLESKLIDSLCTS